VKATDVKELKGLFYTVQIGVYNSEVSKARLKNLPDIVSAHINNQVRYSSGKYCTPEQASVAKNNAVAKGISDAFVTAYYKGERITLSQAKDLVASGVSPCSDGTTQTTSTEDEQPVVGSQQPSTSGSQTSGSSQPAVGSQQPAVSGQQSSSVTQNTPLTTQDSQPAIQNPEHSTTLSTKPPVPETGLVYSVQIGAFREEVPVDIANQFLQLASKGVKNYLDQASGLTVYQFGVCTTKEEAEALREEAVKVGITDAFIVVFKDGRKIPMEDAGN
jgi:cell division septation protein DedD